MVDDHERLWVAVLGELRQTMTRATFETWLVGSVAMSVGGDDLVVGVTSAYAKDWLENRLIDMVERAVAVFALRRLKVRFVVRPEEVMDRPVLVLGQEDGGVSAAASNPVFVGFEPFQANFVQVPRQFFEVVLRGESPVVVAFVAGVIAETVGVIVNFHTSERREWWEASFGEIGRVCGIQSRVSVRKAVRVSRVNGYVVRSRGRVDWRYRLRRLGEPVDGD